MAEPVVRYVSWELLNFEINKENPLNASFFTRSNEGIFFDRQLLKQDQWLRRIFTRSKAVFSNLLLNSFQAETGIVGISSQIGVGQLGAEHFLIFGDCQSVSRI